MVAAVPKLFEFLRQHRARLGQGLLLVAVVVFVLQAEKAVPRETRLEFGFGAEHRQVTGLRLSYLEEGGLHQQVQFRFAKGAPKGVEHRVDLLPGRYDLRCELTLDDGSVRVENRVLEVPAQGLLRFDL